MKNPSLSFPHVSEFEYMFFDMYAVNVYGIDVLYLSPYALSRANKDFFLLTRRGEKLAGERAVLILLYGGKRGMLPRKTLLYLRGTGIFGLLSYFNVDGRKLKQKAWYIDKYLPICYQ
jgi:hypothetical protein